MFSNSGIDAIKEYYQQRDRREQIMLLALTIALLLYATYQLLIVPLQESIAEQQQQVVVMQESYGRVQSLAQQFLLQKKSGQSARPNAGSLTQQIDSSLKRFGLTMQGMQSGANGEVRLRLQSVSYASLMRWLHEMENESGVQLVNVSLVPAKESGRVMANVRLKRGS